MRTRVQKWGHSLAVRIPKSFAEQAGLEENVPAEMSLAEGKLLIEPIAKGYPFEVQLPTGLPVSGVVLADQVKSLDQ